MINRRGPDTATGEPSQSRKEPDATGGPDRPEDLTDGPHCAALGENSSGGLAEDVLFESERNGTLL